MSETPAEARAESFVEHLRLIHLSLLAVCLAIIIAVTSTVPSRLDRSSEETKQLLDLRTQWQAGDWLNKTLVDIKTKVRREDDAAISTNKVTGYRSKAGDVFFSPPQPGRNRMGGRSDDGGSLDWLVLATSSDAEARALPKKDMKWETVGDAEQVWDTLDRHRYAVFLHDYGDGWSINESTGASDELKPHMVPNRSDADQIHVRFYLRTDLLAHLASPREASRSSMTASQNIGRDYSKCYLYGVSARGPAVRYIFRADCASEPIDLQLRLVRDLPWPRPGQGDFAHSFPNLDDLAKHLKGLSLGDLQLFIASEQRRSGEKVEIFGAKLPQDSVAIWGIGLLLVVIAYFWIVLRQFTSNPAMARVESTVAWIGTAKDAVSRTAFATSLAIPLVTAGLLAISGMSAQASFWNALYALGAVIIAFLLGAVALCHYKLTRPPEHSLTNS